MSGVGLECGCRWDEMDTFMCKEHIALGWTPQVVSEAEKHFNKISGIKSFPRGPAPGRNAVEVSIDEAWERSKP